MPSGVVFNGGIDSAWVTGRAKPHEFAIVEAKANFNPAASLHSLLGEANDQSLAPRKKGGGIKPKGGGIKSPVVTPSTSSATPPASTKVMQMSHVWIQDRVKNGLEFRAYKDRILYEGGKANYSRHVFLVSPLEAAEHTQAITKIMTEGMISNPPAAQKYAKDHAEHKVAREFGEHDLDAAEQTYKTQGKYKKNKPAKSPKGQ